MSHSVSTTDGKVPPEEAARLVALHGSALAAEIIAEVESRLEVSAAPEKTKAKRGSSDPIPTSENQE